MIIMAKSQGKTENKMEENIKVAQSKLSSIAEQSITTEWTILISYVQIAISYEHGWKRENIIYSVLKSYAEKSIVIFLKIIYNIEIKYFRSVNKECQIIAILNFCIITQSLNIECKFNM